jgi:mannose-1-phosphate guanylyltransferase
VKAFLLAAGEGRRLRPLTENVPKCLIPIRGTPLMALWLALLERHGVTEVLINLHYAHDRVVDFLRAHQTSVAVRTTHERQLLGSAGTVLANRRFVEGEDRFLILYADNQTNVDLRRMIQFHDQRTDPITIGVAPTDRPWEKGTVVVDDDGHVLAFEEKAAQPRSNLANTGIYVTNQEIFDYMPAPTDGSVLDFGHHVLPRMVPRLGAYRINEYLIDIGTLDNYQSGQAHWPGL